MDNSSRLFSPLRLGKCQLRHRVAMSPLTRFRADDLSVQMPFAKEYYAQRASVPGTFLVSEATSISRESVGFSNVPGIWNAEQVRAWKEIADDVHCKGSFLFLQLWATGRSATPERLQSGDFDFASSSAVPMEPGGAVPRELTEEDIHDLIARFAEAARRAIDAGMDGIELHAANGYLIDQFTQASCNQRTDRWGGSIENRARFAIEVTRSVVAAVGADRVGVKLSPWGKIQGMGTMQDLVPQFQYLVSELRDMGLAYLRLSNSRWIDGVPQEEEDNSIYVHTWGASRPVLLEGGYDPISAQKEADIRFNGYDAVIAFGRFFISNPDLPFRIKAGVDLQKYNRDTFYTPISEKGYIDYPFSTAFLEEHSSKASLKL
uniref:Aldehyde reductase FrzD n=1 Tax=Cladobotryum sp. TaxID=2040732 RepID=FRZD_CLASX|nr:FrzD [Cladobotryum sp.]